MIVNHPSRKTKHHSLQSLLLARIFPYSSEEGGREGGWEGILMERAEVKSYNLQQPQLRGTESPEHGTLLQGWRKMDLFHLPPSWGRVSAALHLAWGNTEGISLALMDWLRKSSAC